MEAALKPKPLVYYMDTRERSGPSLEDHVRYHYNVYVAYILILYVCS